LPTPGKTKFQISPICNEDLFAVWRYIAADSGERRANTIEQRIFRAFDRIARNPGLGHTRYDLTDLPFLFFSVQSWTIVYDPKQVPLSFEAVLHGARDVSTILSRRR